MHDPLDRLFRDIHRSGIRGDRFDIAYGLRDPGRGTDVDDEPWEQPSWDREQSVWATIAGLLGVSLQGVIGYFPLGFTLFVAPLAVIVGLYALWVLLLRMAVRQRSHHPWLVLAIPVASVAVWGVVMWIGWTQFHWPPLRMPGLN